MTNDEIMVLEKEIEELEDKREIKINELIDLALKAMPLNPGEKPLITYYNEERAVKIRDLRNRIEDLKIIIKEKTDRINSLRKN